MRKSRIVIFLTLILVLALLATGLFACRKNPPTDPEEGRVVAVATAMDAVYGAMVASDGSVQTNFFTLKASGGYSVGEDVYDVSFGGTFDITQNNRDDDRRSQLLLEVKKGGIEVFLLYYSEGTLYLDFPPYARRGKISDFCLAEAVHRIVSEKESGVIKTAADTLPLIASRVFTSCRSYSGDEGDRYVFALSYPALFEAFGAIVASWDAGFSPAELLSALHLTEEDTARLSASGAATSVEFVVKDGAFVSAKATADGKGEIRLDSFSLTRGTDEIALPSALSSFTEFDLRNFALSGTMVVKADGKDDRNANYDLTVNTDFDATYAFSYDFKSHYVAGQGPEFDLALTDPNGKASSFAVRGEYLYLDLTAYGVKKCKIKTEELSDRLAATGFKDTDEYDFRDRLHLLVLLAAGRTENGDTVTYDLGKDFFNVLFEKIGFRGVFGVDGAKISWSKANNRLQNLNASLTVLDMTASLTASTFTFGTPVTLSELDDASYVDLATKQTTHLSFSGSFRQSTRFETDGEILSSLLSSLSGEDLTFNVGALQYTADIVFGKTGALDRLFVRFYGANGGEIVNVYYTEETSKAFYLIYPEDAGFGVRAVRSFALADEPLAAFNDAIGVAESGAARRLVFSASSNAFMFGAYLPVFEEIVEKIARIYPDFSLPLLTSLRCRRFELRLSGDTAAAKVVFDSDNDLTILAENVKVTYGDDWKLVSLTATTPETVAILQDNDMPEEGTAVFDVSEDATARRISLKVSLKDFTTGEKIWTYANVPHEMGRAGRSETVIATATLLGKTIQKSISVDLSPATEILLANSALYSDRYDGDRTFRMDYYNDVTPSTILSSFSHLIVTVPEAGSGENREYSKEITWDLTGVSTSRDTKDLSVKPKVKTYFGNEIFLGDVAVFTLHIDGEKAVSTEYTKTFVAYDGFDPLDPAVYSDVLVVETADGEKVEVRHVEWDLTNAFIESKITNGILYAYTTDPEHPDIVRAKIFDSTGAFVALEVHIFFEERVVEKSDVTFDLAGLDGVTYAAGKGFTFDVLKVRGLSPTKTAGVLPQSFVVNASDPEKKWEVSGIKWSLELDENFDSIENVLNASGTTGTLTMTIGDPISGYQEIDFPFAFTSVTITDTALLTKDKTPIASIERTGTSLFAYGASGLNAYTYDFPAYVRVGYRIGESDESEDLLVAWTYDKPFVEDALCDGGQYLLTGAVGSETITVSLSFDRKRITGYRFLNEAAMEESGALTTHDGKKCLTFSVLAALMESGVKYKDKASYPQTLEVCFNGGEEYVSAAVTWDLSAYNDRDDMIGSGYFGTISATAKGQTFDVYVYVSAAYDSVYTNAAMTRSDLTFTLLSAGALLPDGTHYALSLTDPREPSAYPNVLYIDGGYSVDVVEWLGLEEIRALYAENYESTAPNEITGNVIVRAKIGNEDVGYKEIRIPVYIVDSKIDKEEGTGRPDVNASGLPFAASSEMTGGATPYAVTPKYQTVTVGGTECSFSLEINPYYVDPTAQSTYPAYLDFKLDGRSVRANALWDLAEIPADAAAATTTKNYKVWAMIDLGASFKKIKIPVAVTVLKREIDVIWIKDNVGVYSNEKYIDIDGYSLSPFGGEIVGDMVYLDVKVQFKKDANRYPLKLRYSKKDVVLSYDGSNIYENITVGVGNDSGGYREIGGYTIRTLSNIISKIRVWNQSEGAYKVFFESVYDELTGKETYNYYSAVDMGEDLPTEIKVTFNRGEEKTVSLSSGANEGKGVVYAWTRSEVGHYLGVLLWNPSVSEAVGGEKQAVYNDQQKNYATPTAEMFFDANFTNTAVYRDSADAQGPWTVAAFLADREEEILTSRVARENQTRYITLDEDDAARKGANEVLTVGTYRLYISVEGHERYAGTAYRTFTITPKDVSSYVALFVNGARRSEADPKEKYTGSAYQVRAKVPDYNIDVPLLVDGLSSQDFTDVWYVDGNVAARVFAVTVDASDQIGRNYKVEDATVAFKITEIKLPAADADVRLTWAPSREEFDVTVKVFGNTLSSDPSLTNGYKVHYYESNSSIEEVLTFTAGNTYYYMVEIKVPNYIEYDHGRYEIKAA